MNIHGVGPLWIGLERKPLANPWCGPAWATEVDPPYRECYGIAMRLGPWSLRFGLVSKRWASHNEAMGLLDLDTPVEEIAEWEWRDDEAAPEEGLQNPVHA